MAKHSQINWWVFGLIGGLVVGLLFAPKKGSLLRSQLSTVHKKEGIWGQTLWMKDELIALCENVQDEIGATWHSTEVQAAVARIIQLTKELLPRIEGKDTRIKF